MKKFNFKSMFIGLVIGISISVSTIALAAPQQIEVLYDNIKVFVNGKELTMDEQPFIKNGRTFIPLRFVAEAFGSEVVWNETTSTVNINSVSNNVYTTPTSSSTPTPTVTTTSSSINTTSTITDNGKEGSTTVEIEKPIYEIKDGIEYAYLNGKTYITIISAWNLAGNKIKGMYDSNTEEIKFINKETNLTILEHIKIVKIEDKGYLEYENFKNNILPKLK